MRGRGFAGELVVLAGLALLLAVLGPFGSFATPWPLRVLDWLLFMGGGTLCFRPVIGAARVLSRHEAMPLPLSILFACLLAAFPATVLVAWCMAGLGWRAITLQRLLPIYPEVLLIGGLVTVLQFAVATRHKPTGQERPSLGTGTGPGTGTGTGPEPGPEPGSHTPQVIDAPPVPAVPGAVAAPTAFLQRLPPELGRELICLENEDHYVRVHTGRGSTLILMRLGDAVAELDGVDGLRTHRSWWVARDAVREVVRRDRLVGLRLRNGVEAPVARTMVPVLRAAGWLDGGTGGGATVPPSPN